MFSVTTEYALRAAVFLSEAREGYHTSTRVAEATQVPVQYMSKVLQHLAEAGLVVSQRGPSGGFALARSAADITLLDVVQAVEPVQRITSCPLGLAEHCNTLCPLHKTMDDVARQVQETLWARTLESVVATPVMPLGIAINGRNGNVARKNGSNGNGIATNGANGRGSTFGQQR